MKPDEFRHKVETADNNQAVIYDEAHRGLGSSRALSEINNILKDLMMEMGQKNLLVIIVLPTFFLLDKYAAILRSKGLFHVYERKGKRGFWVYFNKKNKISLFIRGRKELNYGVIKWPNFKGRFLDRYAVKEEDYREKKRKSFKDNPRTTKAERYIEQRDRLIWLLYQFSELNSSSKIEKAFKQWKIPLKAREIREICEKFRENVDKVGEGENENKV
jgi:hypothetical protein